MQVSDTEADRRTLLAQLAAFEELGGVEDNETYLRAFTTDATFFPADAAAIHGVAAAKQFYDQQLASMDGACVRYIDPQIDIHGDFAVRAYVGCIERSGAPMSQIRYLDVLVRQEGSWKIAAHFWDPRS